jgi:hypothetical protein
VTPTSAVAACTIDTVLPWPADSIQDPAGKSPSEAQLSTPHRENTARAGRSRHLGHRCCQLTVHALQRAPSRRDPTLLESQPRLRLRLGLQLRLGCQFGLGGSNTQACQRSRCPDLRLYQMVVFAALMPDHGGCLLPCAPPIVCCILWVHAGRGSPLEWALASSPRHQLLWSRQQSILA